MGGQFLAADVKHRVGSQQVNEIICQAKILYILPSFLGMDPNTLVDLLAIPSPLYHVHHNILTGHERKLFHDMLLNNLLMNH